MNLLDMFEGREPHQQAIDKLEKARIDHLKEKMDYYAKHGMVEQFKKAKEEHDSYFKVQDECMGYGGLTAEAGIPGNVPTEKIPGKEDLLKGKGRSYYESVEEGNPSKKVFKDKAGKPVGEIGIDPESSPGNSEWYVYHYGTGYSVVGFDNAAEAKRELLYVHKHPEAVEGHESTFNEAGIPGSVPTEKIPGKEDLLKGKGRSYYENQDQKKNSKVTDPAAERLLTKARREFPNAHSDAEALAMKILSKEQDDVSRLDQVNDREDRMIEKLIDIEQKLQRQIDQLTSTEELSEGQRLNVGDPVIVTAPNEFEGKTGEIAELSPSGKFVIVNLYNHGEQPMHLSDVEYNQYAADQEDEDDWYDDGAEDTMEGWSNKMVAQRTGQPPTPYSVYIKGKEWKSFPDDDHAENVANKLRAKFKAEGRDPSVITIAPTDYDKDLKEFAPGNGKDPFDNDPRSTTVSKVQQLLDAGKSVFVLLPGAKGRAIGTQIGDDHSWLNVQYKGWKDPKTRSSSRLTVNLKADDDASLKLTPGSQFIDNKDRPFDYTLSGEAKTSGRGLWEQGVEEAGMGMWGDKGHNAKSQATKDLERSRNEKKQAADRSRAEERDRAWWKAQDDATKAGKDTFEFDGKTHPVKEQGVAEDVSRLSDEEYNRVAAYVKKKYPGTQLSGLGRNPDGSFNVMIDSGSGRHEFKVRFRDPEETDIDEAKTDYSKRRQRERDIDAGKPVAKQRTSKMTDYQKRRAQDKKDMELGESQNDSGVESAIIRRIMVAHTDLLKQFGPQKVMQAAEEVAYNVGDVDEIGTSDVSAYVAQVRQILGA